MVDMITQVEDRVARLIEELETQRRLRLQFEAENSGLKQTATEAERLQAERDAALARIGELEEKVATIESLEATAEEAGRLRSEAIDRAKDYEALLHQFEESQGRVHKLELENSVLVDERTRLRADLEAAGSLLSEVEGAAASAVGQTEAVRAELEAARARIAEVENATASAAAAQTDALRAELETARARAAEVEGWHDGVCRHRDELQAELDRASESVRALEAEKTKVCAERDDLQLRFQELTGRVQHLETVSVADQAAQKQREEAEKELAVVQTQRDDLKERLDGFEAQKEQTRTRLTSLLERIESVEKALEQTELIHELA